VPGEKGHESRRNQLGGVLLASVGLVACKQAVPPQISHDTAVYTPSLSIPLNQFHINSFDCSIVYSFANRNSLLNSHSWPTPTSSPIFDANGNYMASSGGAHTME